MTDETMPDGPQYEDDFYAWTQYQARVLREMPAADNRFDRENVAEEIETVGRNERDAVRSQVRRIIEHFLKLAYSPADAPRFGWMGLIVDARATLEDKLSTTLRQDLEDSLSNMFRRARKQAELSLREHQEDAAAASLPTECPYTLQQILDEDWYPETPGEKK